MSSYNANTYTNEFRRDAVELLRSSGRGITQVARELGVNVNTLRAWRNRLLAQSEGSGFGAVGDKAPAEESSQELHAEIKALRKENQHLKRQRDILKKAASILSEDLQLGMH